MRVPHSAQNFAVGLRLALQLVQCLLVGVPHSGQNFAPTCDRALAVAAGHGRRRGRRLSLGRRCLGLGRRGGTAGCVPAAACAA